jgi:hypothetical protein
MSNRMRRWVTRVSSYVALNLSARVGFAFKLIRLGANY